LLPAADGPTTQDTSTTASIRVVTAAGCDPPDRLALLVDAACGPAGGLSRLRRNAPGRADGGMLGLGAFSGLS